MLVFILKDGKRPNASLISKLGNVGERYMKKDQNSKSVVNNDNNKNFIYT